MDVLVKYKRLDYINRKYFSDYLRHLQLRNIKETTIDTKFWKVYGFLIWFEFKDAKTACPEDIENFYLQRRKTRSPITAFGDIQELTIFFKWLLPDRDIVTFKPQKPRIDIPPEKILQSDNILELLKKCENQRDRALVATFWNSGGRLSELLDANIGHVQFDRYGAIISVNGKTGRRPIRLVSAVPDLQLWLDRFHPYKNDPAAPLFVTTRERGSGKYVRLNKRTVQNLFKRLGMQSGCAKKTNPHAFRHGCASSRAKNMTEAELRECFGWSKGSSMPAIYVHLSSRDIDKKILAIDGVKQEEGPTPDPMAPVLCPRCRTSNPSDARFCMVCSMTMNDKVAQELAEAQKQAEALPEYSAGMSKLQADIDRLTAQIAEMQKS